MDLISPCLGWYIFISNMLTLNIWEGGSCRMYSMNSPVYLYMPVLLSPTYLLCLSFHFALGRHLSLLSIPLSYTLFINLSAHFIQNSIHIFKHFHIYTHTYCASLFLSLFDLTPQWKNQYPHFVYSLLLLLTWPFSFPFLLTHPKSLTVSHFSSFFNHSHTIICIQHWNPSLPYAFYLQFTFVTQII